MDDKPGGHDNHHHRGPERTDSAEQSSTATEEDSLLELIPAPPVHGDEEATLYQDYGGEWKADIGPRPVQAEEDGSIAFGTIGPRLKVLSCAVVVVSVSWALGKRLVKCKRPLAKKQGRHSPRTLSGKSHRGVTSSSGIASAERLQMLEDLEAQRFIDESERLAQATLPSRSNARIHPVRLKSADSSSQSLAGEDLEFGAGFSDPPSLRGALDSPKRAFCSIRSALSGAASAAYDDGHDRNVENDAGDIGASNLDVESEAFSKDLLTVSPPNGGINSQYSVGEFHFLMSPVLARAQSFGFNQREGGGIMAGGSDIAQGEAATGLLTAAVKSAPTTMKQKVSRALSRISEGLRLPSVRRANPRCGSASKPYGAETARFAEPLDMMETARLEDELIAELNAELTGEGGEYFSSSSDSSSLSFGDYEWYYDKRYPDEGYDDEGYDDEGYDEDEDKNDKGLLPALMETEEEMPEPRSARQRLVEIVLSIEDATVAIPAVRLAWNCSLSRSEENADLRWDRVLGSGRFGRVTQVWHDLGCFAIKELTEEAGEDERITAQGEMDTILSLGHHPNVIRVFALDDTLPTMPILMEAGSGDLYDVVRYPEISMHGRIRLLRDAAYGLLHVHAIGNMVHRDVKASNIVVVGGPSERSLKGKVADFGMACEIGDVAKKMTGTPGYIPVELLWEAAEAEPDMDVFSFGVLMLLVFVLPQLATANMFAHSDLLTQEEALEADALSEWGEPKDELRFECEVTERTVMDGSFAEVMLVPEKLQDTVPCPELVCSCLARCLSPDRAERPSIESVAAILDRLLVSPPTPS